MILLTSRRPGKVASAVAAAESQGPTLVVTHGFRYPRTDIYLPREASYADVVNAGLERCDVAVKWDDHDYYPPGHYETVLAAYRGQPMFGRVRVRNCATGALRSGVSLCAGALPGDYRVTASASGRIADEIPQSHVISTGVIKLECGDWSWTGSPRVSCDHG